MSAKLGILKSKTIFSNDQGILIYRWILKMVLAPENVRGFWIWTKFYHVVFEVMKQLGFPINGTDIKKQIEKLIEREYMERVDNSRYNYLAWEHHLFNNYSRTVSVTNYLLLQLYITITIDSLINTNPDTII